jgi:hypothetical protein
MSKFNIIYASADETKPEFDGILGFAEISYNNESLCAIWLDKENKLIIRFGGINHTVPDFDYNEFVSTLEIAKNEILIWNIKYYKTTPFELR